jgi:predicted exporter
MIKKLALILVILMIVLLGWALLRSTTDVSISINGKQLTGPLEPAVDIWKLILATVILFCVAILLAFVFAGVALVVLGCIAIVGLILFAIALPFLLPLFIPLFIVWAFCAALCRHKTT